MNVLFVDMSVNVYTVKPLQKGETKQEICSNGSYYLSVIIFMLAMF